MTKASTAKSLTDSSTLVMYNLSDIDRHVITMAKLGFSNTQFEVYYKDVGFIIDKLINLGYNVFSNVNPYGGKVTIELEW